MTSFHSIVVEALQAIGDISQLREQQLVGGGCISQAIRLRTMRGEYLLKRGGQGLPNFFGAEARGLELLAASQAVRVPAVLAWRDQEQGAEGFILLEWLAAPASTEPQAVATMLGASLAALHRVSAPTYGLDSDNYIGATPQPNGWMESWLEFFRERRLRFQADLARRNGHLDSSRVRMMEHLLDHLDHWIDDRSSRPSLLHGDLWSGNYLVGPGGVPAVIDPAVYYGDREAEIAFTSLFGGFPRAFYQAYLEEWPLPEEWQERRDLYNLYHLLNHLNLFGKGYIRPIDAILQRYVGAV